MRGKFSKKGERGATLVEFSICAAIFLTVVFGVLELSLLLWTHNALMDATRRGARYAVNNKATDIDKVKKVVVYGDPNADTATAQPLLNGLTMANVDVTYPGFGVAGGRVVVTINSYDFKFAMPLLGSTLRLPNYTTALTGESAGLQPPTL